MAQSLDFLSKSRSEHRQQSPCLNSYSSPPASNEKNPLIGVIENPILVLFKLRLPVFPVAASVSDGGQLLRVALLELALQPSRSPGPSPSPPLCRAERWASISHEETAA